MIKYLPLFWIILLGLVTTQLSQPIEVQPVDTDGFSATNAMVHLNKMASEIHYMGTVENRKVKDYIIEEFEELDIPTEIFAGHTQTTWGSNYTRIGRTENIIATIKGSSPGKAVMVVGHYDSVLSSPGAADDIHSVACMLEIAKLLKREQHQNDIIFMITDGEENGLFGAKAFTEMRDVSHIGVVLNYEARGNSGASLSFEWSEGNAWLVKQLKKVATRPVATSMSFEIYKNLPNDTDFTYFKEAGMNGINHAFIDGFSYYHNPADKPENINQKSVQHTGTNMLALTQHFANIDLSTTKTQNATFFNFLNLLVIYPSAWDIFILILSLLLVGFLIIRSFRNKTINLKSFSLSFLMILISVTLSAGLAFGLGTLLMKLYPQYESFYAGQFYNHKWYLLTCIGISIVISSLCIKRLFLRSHANSFRAALLLFLALLSIIFYMYITTATYFMLYPTLSMSLFYYLTSSKNKTHRHKLHSYLASLVPLVLWLPTTVLFFLAFSLVGLPFPTLHVTIIVLTTMFLFKDFWLYSNIMSYIGLLLIIVSLMMGHLTSSPTEREPLPSSLFYHYNVDTDQALMGSEDKHINIGNEYYLEGAEKSVIRLPYAKRYWNVDTDITPKVKIPELIQDSIDSNILKIISQDEAYTTSLLIEHPPNLTELYINNQKIPIARATDKYFLIETFGMTADTMTIKISKKNKNIEANITIGSHFRSLPIDDKLPHNALRTDGYTNILQKTSM